MREFCFEAVQSFRQQHLCISQYNLPIFARSLSVSTIELKFHSWMVLARSTHLLLTYYRQRLTAPHRVDAHGSLARAKCGCVVAAWKPRFLWQPTYICHQPRKTVLSTIAPTSLIFLHDDLRQLPSNSIGSLQRAACAVALELDEPDYRERDT